MTKNYLNLAKKVLTLAIIIASVLGVLAPNTAIFALEPLFISNIEITPTDDNATIAWTTNRPTTGKLEYGIKADTYTWSVSTNLKHEEHAITISGLLPNTQYFVRLTADDVSATVKSTEQVFKTLKTDDNKAPTLSKVKAADVTGTTATIQWETDEAATSEVLYGLTTTYGKVKVNSTKTKIHDITLTGLVEGTTYHFLVQSKDSSNNTTKWYDMTFVTVFGSTLDKQNPVIYNVAPVSENDINVGKTSAVISWRTNKMTEGTVRYGTTANPGTRINTNPPRYYTHAVTLTGLKPGTVYYYDITAKDTLGKTAVSTIYSFKTKSDATTGSTTADNTSNGSIGSGVVLGSSTCDINLNKDFGYWGAYYDLPSNHPDVTNWRSQTGPKSLTDAKANWYNATNFRFSRIDSSLKFGSKFFPAMQSDDKSYFAVAWRAIINAPADGSYSFSITSDDDSWVIIDGVVLSDLSGVHKAKTATKSLSLTKGLHTLEIFYADRAKGEATMSFTPDANVKIHPLPEGCDLSDASFGGSGLVLGVSNEDDLGFGFGSESSSNGGNGSGIAVAPAYACNPSLGYTKIKALYKTTASPDIWAMLETGQKHYITSPESFAMYQCDWSQVKTVSQKFLNGFANATLVRTPANATVYHLFDRPETKWLKINISSPTIFVSYANNYWGNVARINALDIAAYPDVKLIKGENSPTVYLIENGQKRPFGSPETFTAMGYDWVEVATLNQYHLDSYVTGPAIN